MGGVARRCGDAAAVASSCRQLVAFAGLHALNEEVASGCRPPLDAAPRRPASPCSATAMKAFGRRRLALSSTCPAKTPLAPAGAGPDTVRSSAGGGGNDGAARSAPRATAASDPGLPPAEAALASFLPADLQPTRLKATNIDSVQGTTRTARPSPVVPTSKGVHHDGRFPVLQGCREAVLVEDGSSADGTPRASPHAPSP